MDRCWSAPMHLKTRGSSGPGRRTCEATPLLRSGAVSDLERMRDAEALQNGRTDGGRTDGGRNAAWFGWDFQAKSTTARVIDRGKSLCHQISHPNSQSRHILIL